MSEETINTLDKKIAYALNKRDRLWGAICVALIGTGYSLISVIWNFPDTIQRFRQSGYLWDILFEGKIASFYEYLMQQEIWVDVSWLSSLPFSIGIFPLWLINKIVGKELTILSVLYTKLFLFICLALLSIFVYKIVRNLTNNSSKAFLSALFVLGSMEMLDSIGYAGQDEVVYLLLYSIGLFFLLKQKHALSLLFFALSVTACPIMIIPIICNYLVYFKNILKLLVYSTVLLVPSALHEVAYMHDASWQIEKSKNTLGTFYLMMTTGTITSSVGPVPIAFVVIVIVAILSYLVKRDDNKKEVKCIRYGAVVFFSLAFLTSVTFYRYCIYIPIFALLFGISDKSMDLKGFLLFLTGIMRFAYSLVNGCNMEYRFLSSITVRIFGEKVLAGGTDRCIIDRSSGLVDSTFCIIRPIVLGCSLYYLYLCFKDDDYEFPIKIKATVFIISMAGVVLAGFTLYQIMTSF